ncbi:phenylacetate--CoA ligase family protein [Streptomyces sp. NBC_01304]|uniref:phenylacetate--CoA ligase family protein n=1 Tax=Streptomyces sp. NBC_01304 TaxID=2903818 RepID=UPI002E0EDA40|nr:AMP-binding protein [Streptomyces sp. NBC_01304]
MTQTSEVRSWRSFDELRELQDERIAQSIRRASATPHYRERFGWGVDAAIPTRLDQIPVTTKDHLRASYPFQMLGVPWEEVATFHESSGSSGQVTSAFYTDNDWRDVGERFSRLPVDIRAADTLLVRSPYAMVLAGHLAHYGGRLNGATIVPADSRSAVTPYSRVVQLLKDLKVTLTWSMPTEPLIWAAAAREAGLDPRVDFPGLRGILTCGEPLSSARKQRISEIWGVPVFDDYGATEVGPLASECAFGNRHFYADRVFPEIYDPHSGEFSSEGVGNLVITPLQLEAMPMLRYYLEDRVELGLEPCACNSWLPVIRLAGRPTQIFEVADKPLSQLDLEELVFRLPLEYGVMFWRARADKDALVVQLEVTDEHARSACSELEASIRRVLSTPCEVTPVEPGTLMPTDVLTHSRDILKPRSLFGPDEDWASGILYY